MDGLLKILHELYRSVVTKQESSTAKPSVFKSVFVLILTYDLESWVITEVISQVQVAERFLRWVHGVTLRDKVRSCEICRTLNAEPHLGIERAQISISLFWPCSENYPMKDWRGKSSWLNPQKSGSDVIQGLGGMNTSPTLLGLVLVWSQHNYLKLLLIVRYSKSSLARCRHDPP